ncbi:MAG: pyridoxamine 5'-phosphate oxidase family protein [Clostridia bacterium]|nr:pyridoxamine 5'-phosphate oxidase family protein [Clostridia bacterium]
MSDKIESTPYKDLLSKTKEIINMSTAHARNEWKRNHCLDWVMSVIDEDGYPAASMITASRADGFNWVSFCTGTDWNKPNRIAKNPRTCIYLFDDISFTGISLTGQTEVITNSEIKRQMWYDELGDSFKGPDDPKWCVLLFKPERYNIFIDYQTIRGTFE